VDAIKAAAYGGEGWRPRITTLNQEMGTIWGDWGVESECMPLRAVLLHLPGKEVEGLANPDEAQMLSPIEADLVRRQHDALAEAYRHAEVQVYYVNPAVTPPPNIMFIRDLFFMTPEGAILARPASTVRAGEERHIARRLADLGVPIIRSVRGKGTFEGADALWLDEKTVLLASGLRTNEEGANQVERALKEMDVEVIRVELPYGTMHLLGTLNFADRDLAVAWSGRVPFKAVQALRERDFEVLWLPDEEEAIKGMALNFVTLRPRCVLMPTKCPKTSSVYKASDIKCIEVDISELIKAAGGIGCLTGILKRE
jgi:arginine deiminase